MAGCSGVKCQRCSGYNVYILTSRSPLFPSIPTSLFESPLRRRNGKFYYSTLDMLRELVGRCSFKARLHVLTVHTRGKVVIHFILKRSLTPHHPTAPHCTLPRARIPTRSVLFSGGTEPECVHLAKVRPLKNVADAETRDEVTSQSSFVSKTRDMHGDTTANNFLAAGTSGVLRVADLCFKLSMAASAARRTSPRIILATGEQGNSYDAPWLHRAAGDHRSVGDEAIFVVQGEVRPGACNPAWKGNEEGVFWLSLEGLEDPALYVGLKDERAPASKQRGEEGGFSEEAIMVEACIRVPLEGVRAGSKAFEVDLKNGAGAVSLQWSTHNHAHENNF